MSARYPVVVSKFTYLFECKFELTMKLVHVAITPAAIIEPQRRYAARFQCRRLISRPVLISHTLRPKL